MIESLSLLSSMYKSYDVSNVHVHVLFTIYKVLKYPEVQSIVHLSSLYAQDKSRSVRSCSVYR